MLSVSHCYSDIGSNLVRLNMEGEMSYEEQCIHSDGDVIKKKFCLDSKGVWTPKGEWDYDEVRLLNIDFKRIEKKFSIPDAFKTKKQITSKVQGKCLVTDGVHLSLAICNDTDTSQKWVWTPLYI